MLRDFASGDAEAAFDIYRAALGPAVARAFGWDEAFQRANLRRSLESERARVALRGADTVGFHLCRDEPSETVLFVLCVAERSQGRGIGTLLLEDAVASARSRGLPLVGRVLPGVEVEGFYRRAGFRVTERHDDGACRVVVRDP